MSRVKNITQFVFLVLLVFSGQVEAGESCLSEGVKTRIRGYVKKLPSEILSSEKLEYHLKTPNSLGKIRAILAKSEDGNFCPDILDIVLKAMNYIDDLQEKKKKPFTR